MFESGNKVVTPKEAAVPNTSPTKASYNPTQVPSALDAVFRVFFSY